MSAHLKLRGSTYFVRVSIPRPLRKAAGRSEIVRTTGETDRRLAERKKYQIIADIQHEIEVLVDNDPASPSWLERQALGIRKAVSRGEIDSELANDIIGQMRDKHLAAHGKSPEDNLTPADLSRLQSVTRYASDVDFSPISDVVARYLAEKKPVVQHSTYALKDRILNAFLNWLPSDPSINEVNRKLAGRYVSEVLAGNGKHPTTNKGTVVHLSSFFNWASQRGMYDHANPWTGMSNTLNGSTRGKKLQLRLWSDDELTQMFNDIPSGPQYYLKEICAIALYTGARLNEIAELEVTDIDLKSKVIHIAEGKTQSSVRDIPIHSKLLPMIKKLIGKRTDGYLFVTLKPAGRDQKRGHEVSKRFGYWRDQAFPNTLHEINALGHKRSEVNFHSFRRSFISACEQAGTPEPTTKQIVGHAKSSLTYGTYSRGVDLKLLRKAVEKVNFPVTIDYPRRDQ